MNQDHRFRGERRSKEDRRQFNYAHYSGPERRGEQGRRSGIDRRES